MMLSLVALFAAAIALVGIVLWLERVTRWTGLRYAVGGALLLGAAVYGFMRGSRILPLLFAVQAVFLFLQTHEARTERAAAADDEPDAGVDRRLLNLFKLGGGFELFGIMAIAAGLGSGLSAGAILVRAVPFMAIGAALQLWAFLTVRRSRNQAR